MCADLDAVQTAIVLRAHVELALGNGTVDIGILLHLVHTETLFLHRQSLTKTACGAVRPTYCPLCGIARILSYRTLVSCP
jgi:hypothetical protein